MSQRSRLSADCAANRVVVSDPVGTQNASAVVRVLTRLQVAETDLNQLLNFLVFHLGKVVQGKPHRRFVVSLQRAQERLLHGRHLVAASCMYVPYHSKQIAVGTAQYCKI